MIVTSFFEGRVRLKASLFKNDEISNKIKTILTNSSFVENVTINNVTGSMLIEYNPIKIPYTKLNKLMPYFEKIKDMYDVYGEESIDDILNIITEMEKLFEKL